METDYLLSVSIFVSILVIDEWLLLFNNFQTVELFSYINHVYKKNKI